MQEGFWTHALSWRQATTKLSDGDIAFTPKLRIARNDGWSLLELRLENPSTSPVWVDHATVTLTDLHADWQTSISTGKARHEILQYVGPRDRFSVSPARAIYDAAGRPQGIYKCLVRINVRYSVNVNYCVEEKSFDKTLEEYQVEMAALSILSLRRSRWFKRKLNAVLNLR